MGAPSFPWRHPVCLPRIGYVPFLSCGEIRQISRVLPFKAVSLYELRSKEIQLTKETEVRNTGENRKNRKGKKNQFWIVHKRCILLPKLRAAEILAPTGRLTNLEVCSLFA